MSYKTILVYLASAKRADAVLEVAIGLAQKSDAHLIGLHVVPQVPANSVPRYPIPNDMLVAARKGLQAEADQIAKIFADATKSIADRCEWRSKAAQSRNQVAHILDDALTAELIIASQEIDYPMDGVPDTPSRLVLESGRPVLIVPNAGHFKSVGERIVVGWKPGREAARAVLDALPIMRNASSVHILSIDENGTDHQTTGQLSSMLARQDIKATEVALESSEPEQALLDQVKKLNADLLVMGCYGRPRWREIVFGGATRHILQNMTVPVLMTH